MGIIFYPKLAHKVTNLTHCKEAAQCIPYISPT